MIMRYAFNNPKIPLTAEQLQIIQNFIEESKIFSFNFIKTFGNK